MSQRVALSITSSAFAAGGAIPRRHTCDDADVSPPLAWTGVPSGTRSLALIVDDPDAPDPAAPKRVWLHWALYNIPPDTRGLAEGVAAKELPGGTRALRNDSGGAGYGGPCPPIGRHRYFFHLFALDALLPERGIASRAELDAAMAGHVLETAELMGTYARS